MPVLNDILSAEALEHYRQALPIFQELSKEDPSNVNAIRWLGSAHQRMADSPWASGAKSQTLEHQRALLELYEMLLVQYPNKTYQRRLSGELWRMVTIYWR